jgi:hypothetical protein
MAELLQGLVLQQERKEKELAEKFAERERKLWSVSLSRKAGADSRISTLPSLAPRNVRPKLELPQSHKPRNRKKTKKQRRLQRHKKHKLEGLLLKRWPRRRWKRTG